MSADRGEIILYQSEDGGSAVDVHLKDETVWLTLNQISELFDRDKSVISRHLRNIFKTGELKKEATVAKNATVQNERGRQVIRQIEWYNLDAIISVGYRVNSIRGTQFRIWASTVLKDHLIMGYTINQQRLTNKGTEELKQAITLLTNTLEHHNLVTDEGQAILDVINHYARTWQLLLQYDEDTLQLPAKKHKTRKDLDLDNCRQAITVLKKELLAKAEATDIFGHERGHGLDGIFGAVRQSFGGHDLYPSAEEKAAHLLYFIIKDHPFTDGNKRIGTFLFVLFLEANGLLKAEKIFDNRALVSLALLTASSEPGQKDLIIRLIINLLSS